MRLLTIQLQPDGDTDTLEQSAQKNRLRVGYCGVGSAGDDEDFRREAIGLEDLLCAKEKVGRAVVLTSLSK